MIPVAQVSLSLGSARTGTAFLVTRRPVAVVVVSPQSKKAFRITGEEFSPEELLQEYHVLKDYL